MKYFQAVTAVFFSETILLDSPSAHCVYDYISTDDISVGSVSIFRISSYLMIDCNMTATDKFIGLI